MTSVRFENVSKNFGATKVLENINWEILDGEFIVLVGPSGYGKTTLSKVILGAVQPDSGHIYMDGKPLDHVPIEEREHRLCPSRFRPLPPPHILR